MDMVILRLRIKISCLEILLWKSHSNSAFKSHQRSSYPAFASSSSIARSNFVFFSGDGDFPSQIRFRNSSMASVSHGCIAQELVSLSHKMDRVITVFGLKYGMMEIAQYRMLSLELTFCMLYNLLLVFSFRGSSGFYDDNFKKVAKRIKAAHCDAGATGLLPANVPSIPAVPDGELSHMSSPRTKVANNQEGLKNSNKRDRKVSERAERKCTKSNGDKVLGMHIDSKELVGSSELSTEDVSMVPVGPKCLNQADGNVVIKYKTRQR